MALGLLLQALLLLLAPTAAVSSRSHHHQSHRAHLLRQAEQQRARQAQLPPHTVHNFTQTTDHFNFELGRSLSGRAKHSADDAHFTQRYVLLNERNFSHHARHDKHPPPIFVFTGAEGGNVEETMWAYTFMIEVACRMGALVAFFEHRFFGLSIPFGGNASEALRAEPGRVGLLSVEQSLADYAAMVTHLRDERAAWGSPLVTFGGSLAGTLAAFMRLRYPQLVDAAVASSAPVRGYPVRRARHAHLCLSVRSGLPLTQPSLGRSMQGMMNTMAWHKQVTKNFEDLAPGCTPLVRGAFNAVSNQYPWPGGAKGIKRDLRVCEPHSSPLVSTDTIQGVIWQKVESWGEFVYPLAESNRTTIGPACARMAAAAVPAAGSGGSGGGSGDAWQATTRALVRELINTPNTSCLNLTAFKAQDTGPGARAWDYLACTELVHPIGSNNRAPPLPPAASWARDHPAATGVRLMWARNRAQAPTSSRRSTGPSRRRPPSATAPSVATTGRSHRARVRCRIPSACATSRALRNSRAPARGSSGRTECGTRGTWAG